MSAVLEALSKQIDFLKDNNLIEKYKQVLLLSYSMVNDTKTLTRFNRCLKNLIAASVLSVSDARQHKLVDTMARFMDKNDLQKLLR
jgi:hypothetical protein